MGAIIDTLQILERVMEYKKACRDILLAAARSEVGYKSDALRSLAAGHDEDVKQIPLLFKGLTFGHRPPSDDDVPLTEIRPALFQDVGKGGKLNLLGAAIRVEKEAIRLLDNPLQKTGMIFPGLVDAVDLHQVNSDADDHFFPLPQIYNFKF